MRSSLRSTTGTAEAEAEAASGRGPTRPLAPARAPWGYAQGFRTSLFGDLDTWIWQGGRDPVVGRTATTRRVEPVYMRPCFSEIRSGFRVVVAGRSDAAGISDAQRCYSYDLLFPW